MAVKYPLDAQAGLTSEQISSMTVTKQEYSNLTKLETTPLTGVGIQQTNFINNIRKAIVDYEKAKDSADKTNKLALDNCINDFSKDLFSVMYAMIQAQALTVTTTVAMGIAVQVAVPAGTGATIAPGIGTATATNFTIQ